MPLLLLHRRHGERRAIPNHSWNVLLARINGNLRDGRRVSKPIHRNLQEHCPNGLHDLSFTGGSSGLILRLFKNRLSLGVSTHGVFGGGTGFSGCEGWLGVILYLTFLIGRHAAHL